MTYKCVICGILQSVSYGQPVPGDGWPIWRCRDIEQCAARFEAGLVDDAIGKILGA